MKLKSLVLVILFSCFFSLISLGQLFDLEGLSELTPGKVAAENGLWIETPVDKRFVDSKEVVIAQIDGPAVISMIHFATSNRDMVDPNYIMGRELLLRVWWDDEGKPSVDCPFVDFFCDPAGLRDQVDTILVNKRQGYNCYFPMPFRKKARIVLVYQGDKEPSEELCGMLPCYSYVIYKRLKNLSRNQGYFHTRWWQDAVLMGKDDYLALEAGGRGKFVGWNVTVRRPGMASYPVDMNEKFYIDGEKLPSVEFMGIEDSFGFSWGFPSTENIFPLTGYWPFLRGAFAYRFFINDAISFGKTLKVAIGFGENEHPVFRQEFSKPGTKLQLSSTCYWYQTEPHLVFPLMLGVAERAPAPDEPFWPDKEILPTVDELKGRKVQFYMLCGRPEKEVIFAEDGFSAKVLQGYSWAGWSPPVYHCRADDKEVRIELDVPAGSKGLLRIYIIDPDSFMGGRRQRVLVDGNNLGDFAGFQAGRWVELNITEATSGDGKIAINVEDLTERSNAVISVIQWLVSG